MIIETCQKCGGVLVDFALTVNPPIYKKVCTSCGWSWTEEREKDTYTPFDFLLLPSNFKTVGAHPHLKINLTETSHFQPK